jgi:hypothetical protein
VSDSGIFARRSRGTGGARVAEVCGEVALG